VSTLVLFLLLLLVFFFCLQSSFFFQFDPSMPCLLKFWVNIFFLIYSYMIKSFLKNILVLSWCLILRERIWFYCLRKIEKERTRIESRKKNEAFKKRKRKCVNVFFAFGNLSKILFHPFSLNMQQLV
jgi:hypothetical protein